MISKQLTGLFLLLNFERYLTCLFVTWPNLHQGNDDVQVDSPWLQTLYTFNLDSHYKVRGQYYDTFRSWIRCCHVETLNNSFPDKSLFFVSSNGINRNLPKKTFELYSPHRSLIQQIPNFKSWFGEEKTRLQEILMVLVGLALCNLSNRISLALCKHKFEIAQLSINKSIIN